MELLGLPIRIAVSRTRYAPMKSEVYVECFSVKVRSLDHDPPENNDHPLPELNP
jgi:hypothetical protein